MSVLEEAIRSIREYRLDHAANLREHASELKFKSTLVQRVHRECLGALCDASGLSLTAAGSQVLPRLKQGWSADVSIRVEEFTNELDVGLNARKADGRWRSSDHFQEVGKYFDLLADWMLRLSEVAAPDVDSVRPAARLIAAALGETASDMRLDPEPLLDLNENNSADWPPLVSEQASVAEVETIERWRQKGNSLINRLDADPGEKSLIALLGPGVAQAMASPAEMIEDVEAAFQNAEPSDGKFLSALLDDRRDNRSVGYRDASGPAALDDLRRSLVRAARVATELLHKSSDVAKPITDWNLYEVQLKKPKAKELSDALKEAARCARAIPTKDAKTGLVLLGAPALAVRLEHLASNVMPPGNRPARIMGAEVNWVTDCAWHSVIFRSPLYPQIRELALQIDLCSGNSAGPVRRLDPGETIARASLKKVTDHATRAVVRGFRHGEQSDELKKTKVREDFYEAVAQRLWYEHDQGTSKPPFAVSMTFDLELERALLLTGRNRPFHVLVPVLREVKPKEMVLRWLLGTCGTGADPVSLGDLRTPSWRPGDAEPAGPVVVKLNGSPLHRLPRFAGAAAGGALHALLLPELDTMDIGVVSLVANAAQQYAKKPGDYERKPEDVLLPRQAMPGWLLDSLSTPKTNFWLVVGARWSDWSSRSQMFNMLSWPDATYRERRMDHRVLAVSQEIDTDHISLLHWLKVQFVQGDCLDLLDDLQATVP